MANTKSAKKMIRASERKRVNNRPVRSSVRTEVTKAREAIATDPATALAEVQQAGSALDKAATKGVIHPNAAARRKSRLMRSLNKASAAEPVEKAAPKKAATKVAAAKAAAKPAAKAPAKTAAAKAPAKAAAAKAPAAKAPAKAAAAKPAAEKAAAPRTRKAAPKTEE